MIDGALERAHQPARALRASFSKAWPGSGKTTRVPRNLPPREQVAVAAHRRTAARIARAPDRSRRSSPCSSGSSRAIRGCVRPFWRGARRPGSSQLGDRRSRTATRSGRRDGSKAGVRARRRARRARTGRRLSARPRRSALVADRAALDLLSILASEAIPSRIVIIATYAPFGSCRPRTRPDEASATALGRTSGAAAAAAALRHRSEGVPGTAIRRPVRRRARAARSQTRRWAMPASVTRRRRRARRRPGSAARRFGLESARAAEARASGRSPTRLIDTIRDATRRTARRTSDGCSKRRPASGWKFTDHAVAAALRRSRTDDALRARPRRAGDALAGVRTTLVGARRKRSGAVASFRFRHRQWFDLLRGQSTHGDRVTTALTGLLPESNFLWRSIAAKECTLPQFVLDGSVPPSSEVTCLLRLSPHDPERDT